MGLQDTGDKVLAAAAAAAAAAAVSTNNTLSPAHIHAREEAHGISSSFSGTQYDPRSFIVTVPPRSWVPFGWTDPQAAVRVNIGTMLSSSDGTPPTLLWPATFDMVKVGEVVSVGSLLLVLEAWGSGKVLTAYMGGYDSYTATCAPGSAVIGFKYEAVGETKAVEAIEEVESDIAEALEESDKVVGTDASESTQVNKDRMQCQGQDIMSNTTAQLTIEAEKRREDLRAKSATDISVKLMLAQAGLSLILEKPTRRENLSLIASDLSLQVTSDSKYGGLMATVGDVQVDNYMETAASPVLLFAATTATRTESGESDGRESQPLLYLSVIKDRRYYKYVGVRVLDLGVSLCTVP